MLDAFKKTDPLRQHSAELQALIATSREERAALSAMLTQLQLHSAKLSTAASRAGELAGIDSRIKSLSDAVGKAEELLERLERLAREVTSRLETPVEKPAPAPRRRTKSTTTRQR